MATVQLDGLTPDCDSVNGTLAITRRLSDKVLTAFNHASATGEFDVPLKSFVTIWQVTEPKRPGWRQAIGGYDAVVQADLWMDFVKLRDTYKVLCEKKAAKASDLATAQEAMKSAYRAWSEIYPASSPGK
jgi:hypothetical protein